MIRSRARIHWGDYSEERGLVTPCGANHPADRVQLDNRQRVNCPACRKILAQRLRDKRAGWAA